MKEHLKHQWPRYLISLLVGIILMIIFMLTNGKWDAPLSYASGISIGGFTLICVGGLSIVTYYGAFDFITYAFSKGKSSRNSFYDYCDAKQVKREPNKLNFVPYLFVGCILILISIILQVIYL